MEQIVCACGQQAGLHHNPACELSGIVTGTNIVVDRGGGCKLTVPHREPNLGHHDHKSLFTLGDFVHIDGCDRTKARVIAIIIRPGATLYQVSWLAGGVYEPTLEEFRLSLAES